MTAASPPASPRPARNYSGLWTFLRLLGGWLSVAVLAYLLWMPSEEFGWTKMMFTWILVTLLADEFAGWFGYMALALGVLPFLYAGTPEQWFVVFPLIGGALFALLIVKHSGGPFVLPFGALLFAGAILGASKIGPSLDPTLKLPLSRSFQEAAMLPMLGVVGFSFLRQVTAMIVRGTRRRRAARATPVKTASTTPPTSGEAVTTAATPAPRPVVAPAAASIAPASPAPTSTAPASTPGTAEPTDITVISAQPELVKGQNMTPTAATRAIDPKATMIDIDLDHLDLDGPELNRPDLNEPDPRKRN